jgi:hypothetical protein
MPIGVGNGIRVEFAGITVVFANASINNEIADVNSFGPQIKRLFMFSSTSGIWSYSSNCCLCRFTSQYGEASMLQPMLSHERVCPLVLSACLCPSKQPSNEKEGVRLAVGVGKQKREWLVARCSISSQAKLNEYVGGNDRKR